MTAPIGETIRQPSEYARTEVLRILNVSERQLKAWEKQGFVAASATFGFFRSSGAQNPEETARFRYRAAPDSARARVSAKASGGRGSAPLPAPHYSGGTPPHRSHIRQQDGAHQRTIAVRFRFEGNREAQVVPPGDKTTGDETRPWCPPGNFRRTGIRVLVSARIVAGRDWRPRWRSRRGLPGKR